MIELQIDEFDVWFLFFVSDNPRITRFNIEWDFKNQDESSLMLMCDVTKGSVTSVPSLNNNNMNSDADGNSTAAAAAGAAAYTSTTFNTDRILEQQTKPLNVEVADCQMLTIDDQISTGGTEVSPNLLFSSNKLPFQHNSIGISSDAPFPFHSYNDSSNSSSNSSSHSNQSAVCFNQQHNNYFNNQINKNHVSSIPAMEQFNKEVFQEHQYKQEQQQRACLCSTTSSTVFTEDTEMRDV